MPVSLRRFAAHEVVVIVLVRLNRQIARGWRRCEGPVAGTTMVIQLLLCQAPGRALPHWADLLGFWGSVGLANRMLGSRNPTA